MAGLEETGRLDDATIVINGDHGSRISESLYVDYMNDDDLVANYASLFAVRAPGVAARIDNRFASIQDLFAKFMGFDVSERISENFILASYLNGKFVRLEMPEF